MEIKGNKVSLNKSERKRTNYPRVINLSADYLHLRQELDADVDALTQLRADDDTSSFERVASLQTYDKLTQRSLVLNRILSGASIEIKAEIMMVQIEQHLAVRSSL